jgi:bile acid:Na+ symporter, BASS family
MDIATLIRMALVLSMGLLVFAVGLRSSPGQMSYLVQRPGLLLRSLLSMNVLMPLVVVICLANLQLRPPIEVALGALAVSPVPPFLPAKELKLGAREGYVYGLFVASSVAAIVMAPLAMALISARLGLATRVPPGPIAVTVALTVIVPLLLGMLVRRLWPTYPPALARGANTAGTVLLVAAFVPVLVTQWRAIMSLIGDGTLLAMIAFTLLGLALGHALGGPDPQNRTVLALATATRHPAVAISVAHAIFPEQTAVPAGVLLFLIVNTVAGVPYTKWRQRVHASAALAGPGDAGHRR